MLGQARPDSLFNLFTAVEGFECINYDVANGPQFDIVDDVVWDTIYTAVTSLEYVGCVACPPCSTYSQLHSLPGPPPLRDATGPGRYGRSNLLPPVKERVRKHTLITTRVAQILTHFTRLKVPWIFEAPWATDNQVSALNLDEFVNLLAMHGVTKTKGFQCPFGGKSPKPSAWVSMGVELCSMPNGCPHPKRKWQNQRTGEVVHKPHAPTSGKDVYLLENPLTPWEPSKSSTSQPWAAHKLAAYPPLLNRFLVAALRIGVYNNLQWMRRKVDAESSKPTTTRFQYSHGFAEKIVWRDPLRGALQPTEKEAADELAINKIS